VIGVTDKKVVALGVTVVLLVVAMLAIQVFYYGPTMDNLNLQISNQQNQIDSKDAQINSLNSQIANLRSQLNTIQSSGNDLQSQYAKLLAEYNLLLSRISPDKGIQIDSINWNRGVAAVAGVTSVTVRNIGNETVHVISLKLYDSSNVLQSSKDVLVAISPNTTSTINQYLPSNNEGVTALFHLEVETLEGYAVTSNPLPLGQ
jgi:cell division protein FtsL